MSRLDIYRTALLATDLAVQAEDISAALDERGPEFAGFIVDHGLGPMWHVRTGRDEFRESRMTAEALFLLQQNALQEIDAALSDQGISYVVIKGAANRLLLYDNPAIRACHDLDILVRHGDRVAAAKLLTGLGYEALPERRSIGRELMLRRNEVTIDLHWVLLRTGRLRNEFVDDILAARRRIGHIWVPSAEDTLFLLLVHPAFAKHLAGWGMGLHRVVDVYAWLVGQDTDWPGVADRLEETGVRTAAWATLRWMQLLMPALDGSQVSDMLDALKPGPVRRAWLDAWLRNDWHSQLENRHWVRLLAFSPFLHDSAGDLPRAARGRHRDARHAEADLAEFERLRSQ
jgi:hypothetical protein